ncbi:hypothetical protein PoB_002844800 [Plakobranchus ocellatus]|uniref:Uncharacterized protein n=1 Tax=Plakobranchus ocellatus TaxID=259542 RepID=A0AAV4A429_9GAST|nr:hypothetical protein PoB_002844800 [Plakobranchus ocellatus]
MDREEKNQVVKMGEKEEIGERETDGTRLEDPQQGDLRLSGQGTGGGVGTRDRRLRVSADLRADSLATVPPTPPYVLSA